MKQDLALSLIISYRKGKATRKDPSSAGVYLPILTPEYLRSNAQAEESVAAGDSVVLNGEEIVLLWDGSNAGEFFRAKIGILASTMVVLDFDENEFNKNYLFYAFKKIETLLKKQTAGSGIPHVDKQILLSLRIQKPRKTVQSKIAEVLLTVDRAIEQTEALIAKYQRIKTGLMHDLLTHGIDEHGQLRDPATHKFKDSPLGMIPEEWNIGPLSVLTDLQVGHAFKSKDFRDSDGILLLRGENVGYGELDWSNPKYFASNFAEQFREYSLREGDIVIGMDRTFTIQGCKISVLRKQDIPVLLVQRVGRFLPKISDAGFLRALLSSWDFQNKLQKEEKGMDIPHLSREEILRVSVRIPTPMEMEKISIIATRLNERLKSERAIQQKLQKLKTGLMQDLLTGKVSVEPLLDPQNEDR